MMSPFSSTLEWFFDQTTLISHSSRAHQYHRLAIPEDQNIQISLDTVAIEAGCRPLTWHSTVESSDLPVVALTPRHDVMIVLAHHDDGTWQTTTPEGPVLLHHFPEKTQFAPLKAEKQKEKIANVKRLFWDIALSQKKIFANAVIASVVINIVALGTSLYSMQVYDRVIPTQGLSTLTALTLGVFMAMMLELILKVARTKIVDEAIRVMDTAYSHTIFARLLSLRLDTFPKSVGTLSSQLQGYNAFRAFITSASLYLLVDLPFALLFLAIVILIGSPLLGGMVLFFFLISLVIGILFRKKIDLLTRTSTNASNKKMGLLVETVDNAETIKATSAGWSRMHQWGTLTRDGIDDDIAIRHYSELSGYLSAFVQQMSYVGLVAVGAYIVSVENTMTMGSLIACTILSGRMLSPVNMIPNLLVQWGRAKMAMDDIQRVYQLAQDHDGIERPIDPTLVNHTLQCNNVKFLYDANPVISLPSLVIKEGEKVAILGTIGAGKSTLLKLLAGLYKPNEGQILIGGLDIHHIVRRKVTQAMGYLPQEIKLIAGTLRDNLILGLPSITDETILSAAQQTGLMALIRALPQGLDTPIPEGGNAVSGGQRQLIAMTRIFLRQPKIWLLDEPTANMDDMSEHTIIQALHHKITSAETLIVVTHKPQILRLVGRIILLGPQGIIMDGPRDEILKKLTPVAIQKPQGE